MRGRITALVLPALLAGALAPAARAAPPQSCGLNAPDRTMAGEFGSQLQGSYVLLPFRVPAGQTALRVRYCYDQPETPLNAQFKHTLDLDLYEARRPGGLWGPDEFRGSSGSARREGDARGSQVTVSADGFNAATGKTTRSMRPGPIEPGEWAVQLPVAAVVNQTQGDVDGKVAFRVEIDLISDPAFADEPYRPARYRTAAARSEPGWYTGDLHVHADHSEGGATMREAFDYAFEPGGPALDFVSLTDHNTDSAFGEIGAFQGDYPGRLIIRGTEVTTFRGHMMNHGTGRYLDHRTGAVYEARLSAGGALEGLDLRRPARAAVEILRGVKSAGGFNQINHPTIFPNEVPAFANLCRGCSWSYSDEETDYRAVDAIEVATGPSGARSGAGTQGPNPFTATAIDFWEGKLAKGFKIAAIAVSDSHDAGETPNPVTSAPIGEGATVVRAQELSEAGIECGVEAGHTYAKVTGAAGPDIRFEARPPGFTGAAAIMGDTVRAGSASFTVRVIGGDGSSVTVYRNGAAFRTFAVAGEDFSTTLESDGPGRYRLQVQRGSTIGTVSSPIYLEPGSGSISTRDCDPLRVRGQAKRRIRPGRGGLFATRCTASGGGLRSCEVRAVIRIGKTKRKRVRVLGGRRVAMKTGTRRVRVKLNRLGRRVASRHRSGRRMRLVFTVTDGDGASAKAVRRARLLAPGR